MVVEFLNYSQKQVNVRKHTKMKFCPAHIEKFLITLYTLTWHFPAKSGPCIHTDIYTDTGQFTKNGLQESLCEWPTQYSAATLLSLYGQLHSSIIIIIIIDTVNALGTSTPDFL